MFLCDNNTAESTATPAFPKIMKLGQTGVLGLSDQVVLMFANWSARGRITTHKLNITQYGCIPAKSNHSSSRALPTMKLRILCRFYTFPDRNNVKTIVLMMMTADVPIILNMNMIHIFSAVV